MNWFIITYGMVPKVRNEPWLKELVMTTDLLGGQEVWNKSAQAHSTMLKAQGWTDDEVRSVLSNEGFTNKMFALFIAARPGAKSATNPEVAAHIPKGWSVIEDTLSRLIKGVEFIRFLESGEVYVSGEVMRGRAVKLGCNLGIADAVWFLENQALIPEELQGNAYIAFPGTLLRDSDGLLRVPYVDWDGDRWILLFRWLGYDWDGHDRLVSCK